MSKREKDEIEVVTGDGSEIEFSPVKEHLTALKAKPKEEDKKKKPIIIPGIKEKDKES